MSRWLVFGLLMAEILTATLLVILPLPLSWRKHLINALNKSALVGQVHYVVERLLDQEDAFFRVNSTARSAGQDCLLFHLLALFGIDQSHDQGGAGQARTLLLARS